MHPKRSSTTLRLEGPRILALRKVRRTHCECHGLTVLGLGGSAAASDAGGAALRAGGITTTRGPPGTNVPDCGGVRTVSGHRRLARAIQRAVRM